MNPNANPILALARDDDWNDPWGTAMSWAYGVAECLYDADPNMVPPELEYHPGMGGPEVPYREHDPGMAMSYRGEDVSWETNQVWGWLHGEHYQQPIYWDDPTFEGRVQELVRTANMWHRFLDWCRATGKDY